MSSKHVLKNKRSSEHSKNGFWYQKTRVRLQYCNFCIIHQINSGINTNLCRSYRLMTKVLRVSIIRKRSYLCRRWPHGRIWAPILDVWISLVREKTQTLYIYDKPLEEKYWWNCQIQAVWISMLHNCMLNYIKVKCTAIVLLILLFTNLPPYTLGSSVLKHFQHTETKQAITNKSSERQEPWH